MVHLSWGWGEGDGRISYMHVHIVHITSSFLDDFLIVFSFVQINQCVESRSNRNLFSFNFSLFENRLKFGFKIAV